MFQLNVGKDLNLIMLANYAFFVMLAFGNRQQVILLTVQNVHWAKLLTREAQYLQAIALAR